MKLAGLRPNLTGYAHSREPESGGFEYNSAGTFVGILRRKAGPKIGSNLPKMTLHLEFSYSVRLMASLHASFPHLYMYKSVMLRVRVASHACRRKQVRHASHACRTKQISKLVVEK